MNNKIIDYIVSGFPDNASAFDVYPCSLHLSNKAAVFMAKASGEDVLIAESSLNFSGLSFEAGGKSWDYCSLTHENAVRLRELFPFTAPSPVLKYPCSVGVGDRLGIATPGHIRVFERFNAYPVFAQQSMRELKLTGRSFADVIDSASFSVFREDFTLPFGADGDHLKTFEEIEYALSAGCTMITLDCSEHIRNDAATMGAQALYEHYVPDEQLEQRYLGKIYDFGGLNICFDAQQLMRSCLVYGHAIDFAAQVYHKYFAGREASVELEISIDETLTPTKPEDHFFVANELALRGVKPVSLAPRFCGEFQKGVDYRGNLAQFEEELRIHQCIAENFGYKLSIHSGSDKFSVFPLIAKHCKGHFHLKTAGTNWLEAMALVAEHNASLYREIHQFALCFAFDEAKKYYHVSTDLTKIPDISTLSDDRLIELFSLDDARQLIHITYGLILSEKTTDGTTRFCERLYKFWYEHQHLYEKRLDTHIGRHLSSLGIGTRQET